MKRGIKLGLQKDMIFYNRESINNNLYKKKLLKLLRVLRN